MRYALLVAWREYVESAKAKGFWISMLMVPLMLFLSVQAPIWLHEKATPVHYYVVLDQSGAYAPLIEARAEKEYQRRVFDALKDFARKHCEAGTNDATDGLPRSVEDFVSQGGKAALLAKLQSRLKPGAPAFKDPRRPFQAVKLPADVNTNADLATVAQALKPYFSGARKVQVEDQSGSLYAAILIPKDIEQQIVRSKGTHPTEGGTGIQYWSADASDFELRGQVEQQVNSEVRRQEYLRRGLDAAVVRQVEQTYVPFVNLSPKKEAGKEALNATDAIKQWAPSGFVYLLWVAIFVIIQMLLNNTIEEKSNRIIEVLLSSVTPGELMMGKLFGIAAIGLTMVGVWMAAAFGILSWKAGGAASVTGQIFAVVKSSNLVFLFVIYFLLGYLMYAGFILAIGSVCNTIKEAQSYMGLLTTMMVVPLLTLTYIPKDPNGTVARILSWIPFYTPFTMMNRAGSDPPLVDLIGTLILLVVSTVGTLWLAGKVFRIGILRTGQPPRIIEMLRWATRRER